MKILSKNIVRKMIQKSEIHYSTTTMITNIKFNTYIFHDYAIRIYQELQYSGVYKSTKIEVFHSQSAIRTEENIIFEFNL